MVVLYNPAVDEVHSLPMGAEVQLTCMGVAADHRVQVSG